MSSNTPAPDSEQTAPQEPAADGGIQGRLAALEAGSMGLFDVMKLVLVGVVFSLLLGAFGQYLASKNNWLPASNSTKVVYLDFEKVMEIAIRQLAQGGSTSIQGAHNDAQKFQEQISTVLSEYSNSGYVVINKRALIEGSPGADITPQVLTKLGMAEANK